MIVPVPVVWLSAWMARACKIATPNVIRFIWSAPLWDRCGKRYHRSRKSLVGPRGRIRLAVVGRTKRSFDCGQDGLPASFGSSRRQRRLLEGVAHTEKRGQLLENPACGGVWRRHELR